MVSRPLLGGVRAGFHPPAAATSRDPFYPTTLQPVPDHEPNPAPRHPPSAGLLLVISGPSGVGKTTITRQVVDRLGAVFSVSATTRPPTAADTPGVDYHFVSDEEFQRMMAAGDLLEYARVFGKFSYGTPRRPVEEALDQGRVVLLEIDVQGALQVRANLPEALLVFILPPDDATLLERLRKRGREGEEEIARRFAEAKREIATAEGSGAYDLFLVNDEVEKCVAEVCFAARKRLQGGVR